MRQYIDNLTRECLPYDELSTLKLSGVIKGMTGKSEVHLSKPHALVLAKWLGHTLARPDVEIVDGPGPAEAEPGSPAPPKCRRKGG